MRRLALLVGIACAVAACLPSVAATVPKLKPCAVVYSVARCQAMTDIVAADVSKNRDDVVSVAVVPDAPPGGVHLSAGWHIRLRIGFKDGSTHDKVICGGVVHEPACLDETRLEVRSKVSDGYRDVPEGAAPPPALEASAVEAASPIALDSMSVPIGRLGEQEVIVGEGSLPNGVWTTGSFDFATPWPEDVALRDAIVTLELRSLEPGGKPFDNLLMHGWRSGVERVRAVLVFDVLWFRRGATLEIRNLKVG